jgi:hypothetical protein
VTVPWERTDAGSDCASSTMMPWNGPSLLLPMTTGVLFAACTASIAWLVMTMSASAAFSRLMRGLQMAARGQAFSPTHSCVETDTACHSRSVICPR